jgi:hypothetical protein
MSITVTLPDGKPLELPDGATGADAAAAIGPGLARAALAIEVSHPEAGEEGEVRDLARALPDGARVSIITAKSGEKALELIRHDAAHVLAAAVTDLYDGVKISIPTARPSPRPTSRASKSGCVSTSRPPRPSSVATSRQPRRASASWPSARTTRSS